MWDEVLPSLENTTWHPPQHQLMPQCEKCAFQHINTPGHTVPSNYIAHTCRCLALISWDYRAYHRAQPSRWILSLLAAINWGVQPCEMSHIRVGVSTSVAMG